MKFTQQSNILHFSINDNYISHVQILFSLINLHFIYENNVFYLPDVTIISNENFKKYAYKLRKKDKINLLYNISNQLYNQLLYLHSINKSFLQIDIDNFFILKHFDKFYFFYFDFDNLFSIYDNYILIPTPFKKYTFYDPVLSSITYIPNQVHISCYYIAMCKLILDLFNISFTSHTSLLRNISFLSEHPLFDFFKFACKDDVDDRILYLIN
jgi:hypothetical protein